MGECCVAPPSDSAREFGGCGAWLKLASTSSPHTILPTWPRAAAFLSPAIEGSPSFTKPQKPWPGNSGPSASPSQPPPSPNQTPPPSPPPPTPPSSGAPTALTSTSACAPPYPNPSPPASSGHEWKTSPPYNITRALRVNSMKAWRGMAGTRMTRGRGVCRRLGIGGMGWILRLVL